MNIARIIDGTVVNIEVATQEWLDAQDDPAGFVPYTDGAPALIGATWDGKAFVTPPSEYERGKADGASGLLALQANAVAEAL